THFDHLGAKTIRRSLRFGGRFCLGCPGLGSARTVVGLGLSQRVQAAAGQATELARFSAIGPAAIRQPCTASTYLSRDLATVAGCFVGVKLAKGVGGVRNRS